MNKMKINILALGVAALTMTGCSESFLDTTSKTELNSTSFYKTEVQAEYAVVGCYDGYQRTVSNGNWPSLFQAVETMSDDCLGGGGPDDRSDRLMDRFDRSYMPDQIDLFNGLWDDYYKGINRCNLLLASLDNIGWTSEEARKVVESEARAIRGLEYFDLVRMFERVPLLTASTTEVVPQSEPDAVYEQIVADLKFAADNMPEEQYADKSNNLGRITKYAAAAMLARVYLFYDGVYNDNKGGAMPGGLTKEQALQYCEEVIKSQRYSLEPEFKNLWPAASTEASTKTEGRKSTYVEDSNEIVWVVKFNNDQNWNNSNINGNKFIINLGLRNVTSFAPYGNGWGACPVTPYANSLFRSGDSRSTATVIDCAAIGAYKEQITTDCMDYTGLVNKKYCPLIFTDGTSMPAAETTVDGGNMQTNQDQNWILIRYADVLLMAAELGSANAMQYFNQVRDRAYGAGVHDITTAPTREQIWNERRVEFMGEGVRYFDLRRQGLDAFVAAQMGQANANGQTTGNPITIYNNKVPTTISSTYVENNIRTKRGFFQIPNSQITLSGHVYKQNAGWE
jgi:hypothetical protein